MNCQNQNPPFVVGLNNQFGQFRNWFFSPTSRLYYIHSIHVSLDLIMLYWCRYYMYVGSSCLWEKNILKNLYHQSIVSIWKAPFLNHLTHEPALQYYKWNGIVYMRMWCCLIHCSQYKRRIFSKEKHYFHYYDHPWQGWTFMNLYW